MKTLIEISDYYYVVADEVGIKAGDKVLVEIQFNPSLIRTVKETTESKVYYEEGGFDISPNLGEELPKVIATTNPELPLPQITNASDELVGKEVEIVFSLIKTYSGKVDIYDKVATIKPILNG